MARGCEIERMVEREREREGRENRESSIDPGYTYLQIYLSRFDRVVKLKGQTTYARYSVRAR